MSFLHALQMQLNRRTFLARTTNGLGTLALASFLRPLLAAGQSSGYGPDGRWVGITNPPHWRPRIKRVIFLCQAGGPSHLETLDYKPELARRDGESMPKSMTQGEQIAQLQGNDDLRIMGPQHPFRRYGESGQEICTLFPHLGSIADDICIVRSMQTEQINHDPAHTFMNTGTSIAGRPSMGSWLQYGLGSETDNLPGFVVLTSVGKGGQAQPISSRQWHSGFLPSKFQGVQFQSAGDPVHYVNPPPGVGKGEQKEIVDTVNRLNAQQDALVDDPEIATRISQYEMAFRMQASVPELVDFSGEPQHILDLYGARQGDGSFASNCLLARRMAERGVRFIQLYHRAWDHHGGIKESMEITANEVDRASAALVKDLKQRGMLDDTLVIWGGEFGRTPMAQGSGRDHHILGFSIWMAGGGVRGGMTYGKTDEFGYRVVENPVHVHDFHATLLHQFGIDHKKLTYRFQGRDFRLTDVEGEVIHDLLV